MDVKITLRGSDVTDKIISLTYSDFEHENIDTLTLRAIKLNADFNDKIELFIKGTYIGAFYISDITTHYKKYIELNAHTIDYSKAFKAKKSTTLKGTLEDIIKNIALKNSLRYKIDFKNKNKNVEIEQFDKSDAQILDEMANSYNCSLSIKNQTLIFLDKDKEIKRPIYTLDESDLIELSLRKTNKTSYNSVMATFHDLESGETKSVRYGQGEPTLNRYFISARNEEEALHRAKESLRKNQLSNTEGRAKIKGRVLFASGKLRLKLEGKSKEFLINKVTHRIDPAYYECDLEFS